VVFHPASQAETREEIATVTPNRASNNLHPSTRAMDQRLPPSLPRRPSAQPLLRSGPAAVGPAADSGLCRPPGITTLSRSAT
jgi:hypothetical protein